MIRQPLNSPPLPNKAAMPTNSTPRVLVVSDRRGARIKREATELQTSGAFRRPNFSDRETVYIAV
jgi:hypothetical protein